MAFLRCCYHQILGPLLHLPKFANGLCRYSDTSVHLDSHLMRQATESYVERGNAFGLISHRGLPYCLSLFDHLVGAGEQRRGEGEGERPCRLQVDQELKLGGLINRNVTGLGTFEDFVHVIGHAPE
jgi:hypothetical protein